MSSECALWNISLKKITALFHRKRAHRANSRAFSAIDAFFRVDFRSVKSVLCQRANRACPDSGTRVIPGASFFVDGYGHGVLPGLLSNSRSKQSDYCSINRADVWIAGYRTGPARAPNNPVVNVSTNCANCNGNNCAKHASSHSGDKQTRIRPITDPMTGSLTAALANPTGPPLRRSRESGIAAWTGSRPAQTGARRNFPLHLLRIARRTGRIGFGADGNQFVIFSPAFLTGKFIYGHKQLLCYRALMSFPSVSSMSFSSDSVNCARILASHFSISDCTFFRRSRPFLESEMHTDRRSSVPCLRTR